MVLKTAVVFFLSSIKGKVTLPVPTLIMTNPGVIWMLMGMNGLTAVRKKPNAAYQANK